MLATAGAVLAAAAVLVVPGAAGRAAQTAPRGLVGGELVLVVAAILAAAVLSSLPPPSKALAFVGNASAHVGPGAFTSIVKKAGYELRFRVTPNRAAIPNSFEVRITRVGSPVRNADVILRFAMLDMEMPTQAHGLVTPHSGAPFNGLFVDHATG